MIPRVLGQLHDAWRGLRAAPGTVTLAVAILTLGIGAGSVTFSVVDAVALRPLPFQEPERLIVIARTEKIAARPSPVAPQDFFTWQEQTPALEGLAGAGPWSLSLTTGDTSERLVALRVTANFFEILQVAPALGSAFTPNHQRPGDEPVVILGHAAWQRRFGGDPAIIGRTFTFGRETRRVIGVMPPGFTYPVGRERTTEAYVPFVVRPADRDHGSGGRAYFLQAVGRLRSGATIAQVEAQVTAATDAVRAAYPQQTFWKDSRPIVSSLHDSVVGPAGRWLVLLLGAVATLLLIAYVNVANLLLARAASRAREFAVRSALGASRWHIARMLTIESLMLSIVASALGLTLAYWGLSFVTTALPAGLARASTIALDGRVLTVAIFGATATALLFGAVPAWVGSRADVVAAMKQGGSVIGESRIRLRWQRVLLISELAFVVTLLVATALFVTSFVNVLRTDLGFNRGRLVGFSVARALGTVGDPDMAAAAFVDDALGRASRVPGVLGAAMIDGGLPLYGMVASYTITVEGYGQTTGADMVVMKSVTPTYFEVAGIRFISGRTFAGTERKNTPKVAILNEEAARRFFAGRDPLGHTFTFRGPTTVVGVVSSVRMTGPEGEVRPEMYVPLLQEDTGSTSISGDVVVRLADSQAGSVAAVQAALKDLTRNGQPPEPSDIDARFREITAERRFNAGLMSAFGLMALVIAAFGVYGLTSFVVGQQSRAIGIRMALGATRGRIFRGVLADAGRLLAAGLAIGLTGGWAASRLFAAVVFGVDRGEPWLYAAVAGTLLVACVGAAMTPALRAARVDPHVALRAE